MDNLSPNPDISNHVNPIPTHTSQLGFSSTAVGGKKRHRRRRHRTKSRKHKSRSRRHTRRSRRHRTKSRRQRGGVNPSYRAYSTSLEPGHNGIYANGPSIGKIIEKYD
jgi:hypothetical protein